MKALLWSRKAIIADTKVEPRKEEETTRKAIMIKEAAVVDPGESIVDTELTKRNGAVGTVPADIAAGVETSVAEVEEPDIAAGHSTSSTLPTGLPIVPSPTWPSPAEEQEVNEAEADVTGTKAEEAEEEKVTVDAVVDTEVKEAEADVTETEDEEAEAEKVTADDEEARKEKEKIAGTKIQEAGVEVTEAEGEETDIAPGDSDWNMFRGCIADQGAARNQKPSDATRPPEFTRAEIDESKKPKVGVAKAAQAAKSKTATAKVAIGQTAPDATDTDDSSSDELFRGLTAEFIARHRCGRAAEAGSTTTPVVLKKPAMAGVAKVAIAKAVTTAKAKEGAMAKTAMAKVAFAKAVTTAKAKVAPAPKASKKLPFNTIAIRKHWIEKRVQEKCHQIDGPGPIAKTDIAQFGKEASEEWKTSDARKELIVDMGPTEAKRRRMS